MTVKAVVGNVKSLDSKGNAVEFTINASELFDKLNIIIAQLKIFNAHLEAMTGCEFTKEDVTDVNN